ncbi:MAG: hypothetical protein Q4C41_03435 [Eggerthellaceae bacterium]|nr:hypothetical protein [Eggerthellaceae bacterium]
MINVSIGLLGVALQASKDQPATEPAFTHGLTGGGLVKPERTIESKPVACGLRANSSNSAYVSEVNMGVDFECLAYADVLALYAFAECGSIVSAPADVAGYFKHTITLGSQLPYLTFWGQVGDTSEATVQKAIGCKMDTLELSFEGNAPLDVGVTAAGIDAALFGSWAGETEPSCFDGYFVPTNGEFLIDTNSNVPAAATVTKGDFSLSNSLTAHRSAGRVVANEISEGKLTTGVNMTVVPDDFVPIRKVLTGSATGTEVSSAIVYGSCKWSFTHSQDENCKLDVEMNNIPWNCETPEIDPEGNSAEIQFSASDIGIASKTGTPITITIVNKVESYTN